MSFDTQNFPWSLVGQRVSLPLPNNIQEGYTYFAEDTDQGFILVIDPYTKIRTWHQFSGLGSVPMDLKFAGGVLTDGGGAGANGFIADTVGDSATTSKIDPLGYVFASTRTVRALVVRVVSDTSTIPATVELFKNGAPTGLVAPVPATSPVGTIVALSPIALLLTGGVDSLDVEIDIPSGNQGVATLRVTATVEYT